MLSHHSFCIILVFCLTSTVLLLLITVELYMEEKNVGSMYGHTSKQMRGKKLGAVTVNFSLTLSCHRVRYRVL